MGFFSKDKKKKDEDQGMSRGERIDAGQLHTRIIIEMLGKPQKHMEKAFKDLMAKLLKEEKISITSKKYSKTKKQGELFSKFAEIEFWAESLSQIIGICFDYMPSSVEVIEPDKVVFKVHDLNGYLNELQAKLHHVDMLAKNAETQKAIISANFFKIMQNSIMIAVASKPGTLPEISKYTGVQQEVLEPQLKKLVNEGKLKKEGETYALA